MLPFVQVIAKPHSDRIAFIAFIAFVAVYLCSRDPCASCVVRARNGLSSYGSVPHMQRR